MCHARARNLGDFRLDLWCDLPNCTTTLHYDMAHDRVWMVDSDGTLQAWDPNA